MRTLVIEDQPDLLRTLAKTLREEGFAVDTAADGEEGLTKALYTGYDAIVLDLMLPKLNGWEFLERLRQSRDMPVLVLTARDAVPDRIRGLDGGADDYLTKPCDLDELLARVRALIRRSAGKPTPRIEIDDVVIDTASRRAEKAGNQLTSPLANIPSSTFMMLRRGSVVSRTELYEHLLDEDEDTLSNVIDVHVYRLRKKIGQDFLKTRRGLGYCIE